MTSALPGLYHWRSSAVAAGPAMAPALSSQEDQCRSRIQRLGRPDAVNFLTPAGSRRWMAYSAASQCSSRRLARCSSVIVMRSWSLCGSSAPMTCALLPDCADHFLSLRQFLASSRQLPWSSLAPTLAHCLSYGELWMLVY